MTIAADLRAMREYIEAHGFSTSWTFAPDLPVNGGPQCFVGALESFCFWADGQHPTIQFLAPFVGGSVGETALIAGGWDRDKALVALDRAVQRAEEERV